MGAVTLQDSATIPLLSQENTDAQNAIIKVNIEGMTCQSCVRNIEGTVSKQKGILTIKVSIFFCLTLFISNNCLHLFFQVNLEEKSGTINYEIDKVTPDEIIEYIEDMGFDASLFSSTNNKISSCTIEIEGMTCNSCVKNIEGKLNISNCQKIL